MDGSPAGSSSACGRRTSIAAQAVRLVCRGAKTSSSFLPPPPRRPPATAPVSAAAPTRLPDRRLRRALRPRSRALSACSRSPAIRPVSPSAWASPTATCAACSRAISGPPPPKSCARAGCISPGSSWKIRRSGSSKSPTPPASTACAASTRRCAMGSGALPHSCGRSLRWRRGRSSRCDCRSARRSISRRCSRSSRRARCRRSRRSATAPGAAACRKAGWKCAASDQRIWKRACRRRWRRARWRSPPGSSASSICAPTPDRSRSTWDVTPF